MATLAATHSPPHSLSTHISFHSPTPSQSHSLLPLTPHSPSTHLDPHPLTNPPPSSLFPLTFTLTLTHLPIAHSTLFPLMHTLTYHSSFFLLLSLLWISCGVKGLMLVPRECLRRSSGPDRARRPDRLTLNSYKTCWHMISHPISKKSVYIVHVCLRSTLQSTAGNYKW